MANHPKVSLVKRGDLYSLSLNLSTGQKLTKTGLSDKDKATALAVECSNVIVNNLWLNPPDSLSGKAREVLGIKTPPKKANIDQAAEEAFQDLVLARVMNGKGGDSLEAIEGQAEQKLFQGFNYFRTKYHEALQTIARLEVRAVAAETELLHYKTKSDAYEAVQVQAGKKIIKNSKITLDEGQTLYFDKFCEAGERGREQPISILKAFVAKFGPATLISDVDPEAVIKYLESFKDKSNGKRATYITAMLAAASAQTYPVGDIRQWAKKNCKKDVKTEDDFYWLDEKIIVKMIKAIRKTDCGDYWADAMTIQFYLAARPEELPMMQAQNVTLTKKDPTRLYIGPINGVRGVKTEDSKANMPLDCDETKKAVKRRLASGMALLFPRVAEQCGIRDERLSFKTRRKLEEQAAKDPAKKVALDWMQAHKLWNPKMWDRQYHAKLEEACRLVMAEDKKIKIEIDRVDARTLRRSRGRDICVATQSAETAATWLRDDVATVRRHYAKVLPSDIKSL